MGSSERVQMEKNIQLLDFLNNLILSIAKDTVRINKVTLADKRKRKKHLHYAHETVEFIQLESQLQHDELQ